MRRRSLMCPDACFWSLTARYAQVAKHAKGEHIREMQVTGLTSCIGGISIQLVALRLSAHVRPLPRRRRAECDLNRISTVQVTVIPCSSLRSLHLERT
jgi:hypothetical protein